MHLKPYLIDLLICVCAVTNHKLSLVYGWYLQIDQIDFSKLISTAVCFITGFTTLYRFVKEVRNDKKQKQQKAADEKTEQTNK